MIYDYDLTITLPHDNLFSPCFFESFPKALPALTTSSLDAPVILYANSLASCRISLRRRCVSGSSRPLAQRLRHLSTNLNTYASISTTTPCCSHSTTTNPISTTLQIRSVLSVSMLQTCCMPLNMWLTCRSSYPLKNAPTLSDSVQKAPDMLFLIWAFAALAKAFARNKFRPNPRGCGLNSGRASRFEIFKARRTCSARYET